MHASSDYAYDDADELTTVSDPASAETDYTYDDAGRQTAAGADTFAYDDANRLVSATLGGVVHTYTYAGDGRRLSATDDGTTTDFVWDRNFGLPQLVTETDSSGTSLRDYTYGWGLTPVGLTTASVTSYLSTDALGSVLATSDAGGAAQTATSYQPFGAVLTASQTDPSAPPSPMGFTGQYVDPTGLYHLRARQYDPATGRFLTTDPLGPTGSGLASLYAYGSNSPCASRIRLASATGSAASATPGMLQLLPSGVLRDGLGTTRMRFSRRRAIATSEPAVSSAANCRSGSRIVRTESTRRRFPPTATLCSRSLLPYSSRSGLCSTCPSQRERTATRPDHNLGPPVRDETEGDGVATQLHAGLGTFEGWVAETASSCAADAEDQGCTTAFDGRQGRAFDEAACHRRMSLSWVV